MDLAAPRRLRQVLHQARRVLRGEDIRSTRSQRLYRVVSLAAWVAIMSFLFVFAQTLAAPTFWPWSQELFGDTAVLLALASGSSSSG